MTEEQKTKLIKAIETKEEILETLDFSSLSDNDLGYLAAGILKSDICEILKN